MEWADDMEFPEQYQSTVTSAVGRHVQIIHGLTENVIPSASNLAKKRLKEFVAKHTTEILGFLSPDRDAVLHRAHAMLERKEVPPAIDAIMETGLDEAYGHIDAELRHHGQKNGAEGGAAAFVEQVRWLVAHYKATGEEVMRLETVLHDHLQTMDAVQSRVNLLTSLKDHPRLEAVLGAYQEYVEGVMADTKVEETYRALIEQYKVWSLTRQMLSAYQTMSVQEPKCSICVEGNVGFAMSPCGHTLCTVCAAKVGSRCFLCRGEIKEKVRLYFG
jgi:hypothetical protein